jgi:hypothetical protein
MQERESAPFARTPLETLLARTDQAAHDCLADALVNRAPVDPGDAPPATVEEDDLSEAEG